MTTLNKTVIVNVRVFDGRSISDLKTVVIDGDKIGEDASGATIVDGAGGFLLPGFIDCHVHLLEIGHLELLSSYGVTTALDMGTNSIELLRSMKGHSGLTDIRGCGIVATKAGTRHSQMPGTNPESLVANAEEAAVFIRNRVSDGSDYIKIVADVPNGPDLDTIRALVANAHQHSKLTIAHAITSPSVRLALEAGVDVITHAPVDRPLDDEVVSSMVRDGRIIVPTLSMMEGIVNSGRIPFPVKYKNAEESITALYKAGVPILVGTDANVALGVPANIPHGDSLHHEMELLVRAGMSTLDTLRAATSLPAKYFGLGDRGAIEPGKRADLVLLAENPMDDIRATRSIKRVWLGGIERPQVASS
ncbi:MAG: hypothetical protein CYPHOPRED_001858 [Cyphobasidiales sp. Tagirdzhanova-0007]|nr:MAG: hypothetical protein CYPHOPRED_001858 [Cyphobasidiales sp. Tagirdzhanova-0007]